MNVIAYTKKFILFVKRNILLVLIFAIFAILIGVYLSTKSKNKFEAVSSFLIEEKANDLGGISFLASSIGVDLSSLGSGSNIYSGENIIEILKSNLIVDQVLVSSKTINNSNTCLANILFYEKKFDVLYKNNKFAQQLDFSKNPASVEQKIWQDSVLHILRNDVIKNMLFVEFVSKKTSIIKLTVKSSNPYVANYLCREIIEAAKKLYIDVKTATLRKNIQKMEEKQKELLILLNKRSEIAANENAYNANVALKSNILNIESSSREKTISTSLYIEVTKNLEGAKFSLSQYTPIIQIIDSPDYPLVNKKKSLKFYIAVSGFIGVFLSFIILLIIFFTKENIWQKLLE